MPDAFDISADFFLEFADSVSHDGVIFRAILDTFAENGRPGGNGSSSESPWISGSSDVSLQHVQLTASFADVSGIKPDDTLTVLSGNLTGQYRVVNIENDSGIASLDLNRL